MTNFTEDTFENERAVIQTARDSIQRVFSVLADERTALTKAGAANSIQARNIDRLIMHALEADRHLLDFKLATRTLNEE